VSIKDRTNRRLAMSFTKNSTIRFITGSTKISSGWIPIRFTGKFFSAFSFVFIYCWYNVFWRSFELGPVAVILDQFAGITKTLVSLATIVGVVASLILPWQQIFSQRKPLTILLHLFAFAPFYLLPLFPTQGAVITLSLIGGFCIGGVVGRSLYMMFFEIMDIHPAKVTITGYILIQLYVHINDILVPTAVPLLYYLLSGLTLIVGIVLSFLRVDGEEMERRRVLPENHFRISNVWHLLVMIALLQTCLTLYDYALLKKTIWQGAFGEALNIIPDLIMFVYLGIFGKKLKLTWTAIAFLTLFSCTTTMFLLYGENSRLLMQAFMEPAYRLVDFLFIWVLIIVFYTYGRHHFHLKACLAVFFAVRFGTHVAFEALFSMVEPFNEAAFLTLLPAFLAALLIPATERSLRGMEARRTYAEAQQGTEVLLPPERDEILTACEDLAQILPLGTRLSESEQNVLCYIIDGQDTDVTAYFLNISPTQIKAISRALLKKFEVKSVYELMLKLGKVQLEAAERNRRSELFIHFNLTEREQEIALLLLSAEPAKNIPSILGISKGTVNFHSNNLYRKCDIQSRAELVALFSDI